MEDQKDRACVKQKVCVETLGLIHHPKYQNQT